ncbi:hypothetical protein [Amycolatopsis keratiniphila]|uniref:Uncharacterized protein n=1 Tax=Amycolatopsis keratiniphila subsp. keratiniphila TaxID=227715 RepID=A0A1W2LL35_9PSEU|nr:hypothetical protein [Amycolatopsis keratiniphila]ONF63623.1 hypothetical protein AVR91_0232320 [Amycolatopsis keratiniphila subsp. keratiniphila]
MPDHQWRITKYDPALRSDSGRFTGNTWTSVWDIGKSFDGKLTVEEYLRVESAYAKSAASFSVESSAFQVTIADFEVSTSNQAELTALGLPEIPWQPPEEGSIIPVNRIQDLVRIALREIAWFKIQTHSFFIHFGHDFYMYIGSDTACDSSRDLARLHGLFVEDFRSPYS